MSKRSRRGHRRENPETFGLSTLDTVTCALGGSIVLMLLLASLTDPQAEVTIDAERQILQSGSGKPAESWTPTGEEPAVNASSSLLLLIVDYKKAVSGAFRTKGCAGAIRFTETRRSDENFPKDGDHRSSRTHAITIWRDESVKKKCRDFTVELAMQDKQDKLGCDITLVSGAHYQYREKSDCPGRLKLPLTSNEGEVFRFHRGF